MSQFFRLVVREPSADATGERGHHVLPAVAEPEVATGGDPRLGGAVPHRRQGVHRRVQPLDADRGTGSAIPGETRPRRLVVGFRFGRKIDLIG